MQNSLSIPAHLKTRMNPLSFVFNDRAPIGYATILNKNGDKGTRCPRPLDSLNNRVGDSSY